ncbi:uncharacterized protein PHALS_13208 [Plasmopara halstedii]|uniref:Uncharacterized protein n=1 Tax=Plasmopara halstedii TaxID=4781 RepID=A0A0P1AP00_PLAHL|nr:uncharacterized protein PHALS_13208 [Plasmopara halstedii]CEG42976.1 hypothetical protein PHALS_13208 [Plasmopara halstedii]|eukprot:XP_024579345.1 hypothetical protein PHALS_13208 [Plasmopara halstedii]
MRKDINDGSTSWPLVFSAQKVSVECGYMLLMTEPDPYFARSKRISDVTIFLF